MNDREIVQAFGCVPFMHTKDGVRVLMVLNMTEDDHWEFPKGKQIEGESGQETALRELMEETGLVGELVDARPIDFEFDCTIQGNRYHKNVRYYFCRISGSAEVVPQRSEIRAYEWLRLIEIEKRATHQKMKEVARKVKECFPD